MSEPGRENAPVILSMWTIYDRPRDFPGHIVARECAVHRGGSVEHAATCELFATVEQARAAMLERGLACIGRQPGDEPHIVEVWL